MPRLVALHIQNGAANQMTHAEHVTHLVQNSIEAALIGARQYTGEQFSFGSLLPKKVYEIELGE